MTPNTLASGSKETGQDETAEQRRTVTRIHSSGIYFGLLREGRSRTAKPDGKEELAQLEQLTASFRVSTGSGLSRIKGLGWAEG